MGTFFASSEGFALNLADAAKLLCSVGSLAVTLYFWFIRSNRERVSVAIYHVGGFEGSLEAGGVGLWAGRIYLANRSILPTAIVRAQAEIFWNGTWLTGYFNTNEGSELPWNLPPTQVFSKNVSIAVSLGGMATREEVYANHRLRFTFESVEGTLISGEADTNYLEGSLVSKMPEPPSNSLNRRAA